MNEQSQMSNSLDTINECKHVKDNMSDPQILPPGFTSLKDSQLDSMATYYHYTNSDALVKIVQEKLLRSSEGCLSSDVANSVFLTEKVSNTSRKSNYLTACYVII